MLASSESALRLLGERKRKIDGDKHGEASAVSASCPRLSVGCQDAERGGTLASDTWGSGGGRRISTNEGTE